MVQETDSDASIDFSEGSVSGLPRWMERTAPSRSLHSRVFEMLRPHVDKKVSDNSSDHRFQITMTG